MSGGYVELLLAIDLAKYYSITYYYTNSKRIN